MEKGAAPFTDRKWQLGFSSTSFNFASSFDFIYAVLIPRVKCVLNVFREWGQALATWDVYHGLLPQSFVLEKLRGCEMSGTQALSIQPLSDSRLGERGKVTRDVFLCANTALWH